jgi:hypothetical protein
MLKTQVPILVAFFAGLVVVVSFFVKAPVIQSSATVLLQWTVIIAGFALGLGALNLFQVHLRRIRARSTKTWPLSIWLLFMMVAAFGLGITKGTDSPAYLFIFNNVYGALAVATLSLHAFFLPAAAFRAFRASNIESGLFLTSAVLVMLGQVGIGAALWSRMPAIRGWIMGVPNAAAMRAIAMVAALGYVSTALRMILGLDRTYLGIGGGEITEGGA